MTLAKILESKIMRVSALAVALVGISTSWVYFELPIVATRADVQGAVMVLSVADTDFYTSEVRSLKLQLYGNRREQNKHPAHSIPDWILKEQVEIEDKIRDFEGKKTRSMQRGLKK